MIASKLAGRMLRMRPLPRRYKQCKENSIKVMLLTFTDSMYCENCFYQFKYTFLSKLVIGLIIGFIPLLAIYSGIYTKSIIVFGLILIGLPFLGEFLFAKYCALKPVGLRALRAKLRGNK